MISREEVKKLAALSRITLSALEEENLAKDMEGILAYVGQLSEVEIPKEKHGVQKPELRNVMRPDETREELASSSKLVAAAPKQKEGYVMVKKIL